MTSETRLWVPDLRGSEKSRKLATGPYWYFLVLLCIAGACFGQTKISVGKANKRLSYVDQVLQLVYEEGSLCPSKSGLRYKSVISFVCRPEAGPANRPMLISLDKQTCTLFFSWHTPLACEQVVSGDRAWLCHAAAPGSSVHGSPAVQG